LKNRPQPAAIVRRASFHSRTGDPTIRNLLQIGQIWTPAVPGHKPRKIVDLPNRLVACEDVLPKSARRAPVAFVLSHAHFRKWVRETAAVLTESELSTPPLALALAQKVVVLRKAHGMTQQQLAEAIGIPRSSIAFMETGRTISIQKCVPRLADIFGVPVELFLNGMAEQPTSMNLTQDEHEFITQYRRLAPELKIFLTRALDKAHERLRRADRAT